MRSLRLTQKLSTGKFEVRKKISRTESESNMSVIKVDFEKLQKAKKVRNLSDYKIAKLDGKLQAPTVRKIIRGDVSPTAVNLKRVCDVLELPIETVLIRDAAA